MCIDTRSALQDAVFHLFKAMVVALRKLYYPFVKVTLKVNNRNLYGCIVDSHNSLSKDVADIVPADGLQLLGPDLTIFETRGLKTRNKCSAQRAGGHCGHCLTFKQFALHVYHDDTKCSQYHSHFSLEYDLGVINLYSGVQKEL